MLQRAIANSTNHLSDLKLRAPFCSPVQLTRFLDLENTEHSGKRKLKNHSDNKVEKSIGLE